MRVLWLSTYSPFPPDSGGKLRTHHLVRGCLKAGIEVSLWVVEAPAPTDPGWQGLEVRGLPRRERDAWPDKARAVASGLPELAWAVRTPQTLAALASLRPGDVDAVVLEQAHCGGLLPEVAALAPVVLDAQNLEWQVARQLAARAPRPHRRLRFALESVRMRRLETELAARCALVVAVSEADASALRGLGGSAPVTVLANGADLEATTWVDHGEARGAEVLFTGDLGYLPNVDAAEWLCAEVLPALRRRQPQAQLTVAGRAPTPAVRAAVDGAAGARLLVDVPDMAPVMAAADVFIAPLRMGGGTRVKVLEALAAGLPVVATPTAVEGLDLPDGDLVLLAASVPELATATARALADGPHRRRVGAAGRAWVEEHHDWRRLGAEFAAMVREASVEAR